MRGAVLVAVCILALPGTRSAPQPAQETPLDWSIIERTRVSLLLLDVEVADRDGRPIHGLTRADFTVQIDWREHPIYSVDDLCPAAAPETVAAGASDSEPAPEPAASPARPATPSSPPSPSSPRYILYFDYAHLDGGGRSRATAEAVRWVRETMRNGEEAMVVAYAEQPGLREIVPFTGVRERLIEGILALSTDIEFLDAFALGFPMRISRCCHTCPQPEPACCEMCCPRADCGFEARQQYLQGKHSLTALRAFLQGLEEWPGRKALILFHQHLSLTPSQLYGHRAPGDVVDRIGDQHSLVDEVAAEANLTSTAISSAFVGDHLDSYAFAPRLGVSFGHSLADFTGGRFNRGGFDLAAMTDAAGRAACIYRIGLRLPEQFGGKVLRAKVWVRGRPVEARFRVRVLTEIDRWWRKAQNLMRRPDLARDVPLAVDVFPARRGEKGWSVEARVALDTGTLTWLPAGGKDEGQLELGALLTRGTQWKREMLGRSTLRTESAESSETLLLTRSFSDIAPGDYRLGAFVRDRMGGVFGASAAEIHLPERGVDDLAGPLAVVASGSFLRAALPLLKENRVPGRRAVRAEGTTPVTAEAVERGTTIELHSWICPEKAPVRPDDLVRFVAGETGPQFRFDEAVLAAAGDCALLIDPLSTAGLAPGAYAYVVWWSPGPGKERIERKLEFRILDNASPTSGDEPGDVGADAM